MTEGKSLTRTIIYLFVIILQIIMSQVVTFMGYLIMPLSDDFSITHADLLTAILGMTFSIGVFIPGWLAIQLRWLPLPKKYWARFLGAMLGAYIPLLAFLIIYRSFMPGSPVFWFSILGSVLGFYAVTWADKQPA